jgi:hypothetical protein
MESVVAIGVIVLYAFALAVLWFEFRAREKRSIERMQRMTDAVLDAIGLLRGDLAAARLLGSVRSERPAPPGGPTLADIAADLERDMTEARARAEEEADARSRARHSPSRSAPASPVARRVVSVTRDDDEIHVRDTVEMPGRSKLRLPDLGPEEDATAPRGERSPDEPSVDRQTPEEATRVFGPGERPTMLGPGEPPAFQESTGSHDVTPTKLSGVSSSKPQK